MDALPYNEDGIKRVARRSGLSQEAVLLTLIDNRPVEVSTGSWSIEEFHPNALVRIQEIGEILNVAGNNGA